MLAVFIKIGNFDLCKELNTFKTTMDDFLNPLAPRNPAQVIHSDPTKVSPEQIEPVEEAKYIEGAEMIPLPSKGVFYSFHPNYKNLEELQVRQLDYTDEDILTTRSYFNKGTLFNELLKNVIVDPNKFPATALVPVDRETILLWLRTTSFGPIFTIDFKCPVCEAEERKMDGKDSITQVTWDISKFDIPEYSPEIYQELKENGELKITCPLSQAVVRITVPSIGKSLEAEKRLEQKKLAAEKTSKDSRDYFATGSLFLLVSGVDDKEKEGKVIRSSTEIQNYFKKIRLPISDARYIRKQSELINLSYDTKQDVKCSHPDCTHIEEGVTMPILHQRFLWADE